MLRLISYVKPYRKLVLLAIILLFVEANLELALPDYLSDIVDVGVQQGVIENAVPMAIRQIQMDRVSIFLTKENQSNVRSHYQLIDENSSDYGSYLKDYPALVNQNIYIINNKGDIKNKALNDILQIPLVIVFSLEGQLELYTFTGNAVAKKGTEDAIAELPIQYVLPILSLFILGKNLLLGGYFDYEVNGSPFLGNPFGDV